MTYDELEAAYYVVAQRNEVLEKENTTLAVRNNELEGDNIVLENSLLKEKSINQSLGTQLSEEVTKTIHLKVVLDEERKRFQKGTDPSLILNNHFDQAVKLQNLANYRDFIGLPAESIHKPMQKIAVMGEQTSIVLRATDVLGLHSDMSPSNLQKELHAYAKVGDKIVRYSTGVSMFDINRREDFGVILNQLIDAVRTELAREFLVKNGLPSSSI